MTHVKNLVPVPDMRQGLSRELSGRPSPTLAQVMEGLLPRGTLLAGTLQGALSCCPLPGHLPLSASTILLSSGVRDPSETGLGLVSSEPSRYFWSVADPLRPFFHFCALSLACIFPSVGSLSRLHSAARPYWKCLEVCTLPHKVALNQQWRCRQQRAQLPCLAWGEP